MDTKDGTQPTIEFAARTPIAAGASDDGMTVWFDFIEMAGSNAVLRLVMPTAGAIALDTALGTVMERALVAPSSTRQQ